MAIGCGIARCRCWRRQMRPEWHWLASRWRKRGFPICTVPVQHHLRVQGMLQVVRQPSFSPPQLGSVPTRDRPCWSVSTGNQRGRPCAVTASAPENRRDSAPSLLAGRYADAIGHAELSYSIAGGRRRRLDGELRGPGVVEGMRVGEQEQTKLKMMACRWSQRQGATARGLTQVTPPTACTGGPGYMHADTQAEISALKKHSWL